MKFMFITDTHFRVNNPVRRQDNFFAACFNKLSWVIEKYKETKCDFILHGGDLFDSYRPSFKCIYSFLNCIGNTKWIQVLGNHDIIGGDSSSYFYGCMGMLELYKNFEILDKIGNEQFSLVGCNYYSGIDTETNFENEELDGTVVLCVHSMILENRNSLFDGIYYKDIRTNADIVLSGHYHPGFRRALEYNGTIFINPGSLLRLSAISANDRVPKIVIIEITNSIKIDFVNIEGCGDFQEIFSEEDKNVDVSLNLDRIEFTKADLISRIKEVSRANGIDKCIIDYSINILLEVQNE